MVRTNQGGSVLSFIVIGVAMALLLIGGAYFVRQQIDQPVSQGPVKTPEQPKPQPQKPEQPAKPTPSPTPPRVEKPAPPTSLPQTPVVPTPTPNSELPKTGPVETTSVLVALLLLTLAGVSYIRSRRQLRASL